MPIAQYPKSGHSAKSKPVHVIRVRSVKASIWKNLTEEGYARLSTTFHRSYKTGGRWSNTESMGQFDLIDIAKVANLAFDWISSRSNIQSDQELDTASAA